MGWQAKNQDRAKSFAKRNATSKPTGKKNLTPVKREKYKANY